MSFAHRLKELQQMRLGDIMERAVATIGTDDPADLAWEKMRRGRIHHLVVMNGRTVVGVLSARDLGGARGAPLREAQTVANLMTTHVVTATPTTTVREAANLLRAILRGRGPRRKPFTHW